MGFDRVASIQAVTQHKFNAAAATYHLMARQKKLDNDKFGRDAAERKQQAILKEAAKAESDSDAQMRHARHTNSMAEGVTEDMVKAMLLLERQLNGQQSVADGEVNNNNHSHGAGSQSHRGVKNSDEGTIGGNSLTTHRGNMTSKLVTNGTTLDSGGALRKKFKTRTFTADRTGPVPETKIIPMVSIDPTEVHNASDIQHETKTASLAPTSNNDLLVRSTSNMKLSRSHGNMSSDITTTSSHQHRESLNQNHQIRLTAGIQTSNQAKSSTDMHRALARQQAAMLVAADGPSEMEKTKSDDIYSIKNKSISNNNVMNQIEDSSTSRSITTAIKSKGRASESQTNGGGSGTRALEEGALTDMLLSTISNSKGGTLQSSSVAIAGGSGTGRRKTPIALDLDSHSPSPQSDEFSMVGGAGGRKDITDGGGGGKSRISSVSVTKRHTTTDTSPSSRTSLSHHPIKSDETSQSSNAAAHSDNKSNKHPSSTIRKRSSTHANTNTGLDRELYLEPSQDLDGHGVPMGDLGNSGIRIIKFAFNCTVTSSSPPALIVSRLRKLLEAGDVVCKEGSDGYLMDCEWGDVKFELEVCKLPRVKMFGVRLKRLAGDLWDFKRLSGKITAELQV